MKNVTAATPAYRHKCQKILRAPRAAVELSSKPVAIINVLKLATFVGVNNCAHAASSRCRLSDVRTQFVLL